MTFEGCFQLPECNWVTMTSVKPILSPKILVVVDHEDDISNRPVSNTEVVNEIRKMQHEIKMIAAPEGPEGITCYLHLQFTYLQIK